MPTRLILLHGFAGTARHWDRVIAALPPGRFEPLALELADARPLSADGVADLVAARGGERFVMAGYSMGGRLALHAALALPERVARLVLLSTSAGIEDPDERAARAAADGALAAAIERSSIEDFIERWASVALFAGDPGWLREEVAEDERRCTPVALAATLRGLGVAAMAPMWERLGELEMPVALLAGERDERYVALGRRLADAITGARLTVVPGAGHRLALEAPVAVAGALH